MKRTVRENIKAAYSLHDMNVIAFEIRDDKLIMRTQSGMVKATEPCCQLDGYVEFHGVDWDFCFAYVLDILKNEGDFKGSKMSLKRYISEFHNIGLSIIDQTYGYNSTKYSGWLSKCKGLYECMVEIYHAGDMVFVTEEELENSNENI